MASRVGRGRLGGRTVNRAEVRDALEDGRIHCAVGLVVVPNNEDSHYEIEADNDGNPVDVLVNVSLMPRQEAVLCRLGALAGGPGSGIWRIPPVGAEVMVMVPRGELENGPVIVGELSTRGIPSALDQDSLVIINPGKVIIASQDDKVYLGSVDGTGTQPAVRGDDLVQRVENIEDVLTNHTHPIPVQAGTVVGATCSIPLGATSAPSTAPTGSPDPRSQTTEVK